MPTNTRKKQHPRAHREIPSLVRIVAHCVNPEYRRDYTTWRQSPRDFRCPKCDTPVVLPLGHGSQGIRCQNEECRKWLPPDEFDKKYPYAGTGVMPLNPFTVSDKKWIEFAREFARRGQKIPTKVVYALARSIRGGTDAEIGGSIVGGPDDPLRILSAFFDHEAPEPLPIEDTSRSPITIIPASSPIPKENDIPPNGYQAESLGNLSGQRMLRLEVDLHAPRPTLEKRFRGIVGEFQLRMNLDGRNRDELLGILALYRVTEIAREIKKPPQVILNPGKFRAGKRMAATRKDWDAGKRMFFAARKRAREIFGVAVFPE